MPEPESGASVVNKEAETSTAAPEATADETASSEGASEPEVIITDEGELKYRESEDDEGDEPENADGKAADTDDDNPRSANARVREVVAEKNRLAERNARNEVIIDEIVQTVAAKNAAVYGAGKQPAKIPTVEEIMYDEAGNPKVNDETGEYYTKQEAQLEFLANVQEANKQEKASQADAEALNTANHQIAANQVQLDQEAARVFEEFPIFDQNSPQFDGELFNEVGEIMKANLVYDDNTGILLGANISPYKLYASFAKAYGKAKTTGQATGQRTAEKMLARVDDVDGSGVRQSDKKFEDLSLSEMEASLKRRGAL